MKKYLLVGGALLMMVLVTVAVHHRGNTAADTQKRADQEVQGLVSAVGAIMILPEETPVVATVADPSKLLDQPFFIDAKKGDKVLIYHVAGKAILYDPIAKRIINVAGLSTTK